MDSYDKVAKFVEPKKLALAAAEEEYSTIMAALKIKQDELDELMTRLAAMEKQLSDSVEKKARPSTLNPDLQFPRNKPKPFILHCIPHTKTPIPKPLYPNPYTLYPVPKPLYPIPYTLYPIPYTQTPIP
jgi:hypothetical protein